VTEEEALKLLATVDPLSAMATGDGEMLRSVLEQARLQDDALRAMVQDLLPPLDPNAGLCDPDDVPEPPDEATTQRGDLWILGDHRLLCGDSSSVEDVDRLCDGKPVPCGCDEGLFWGTPNPARDLAIARRPDGSANRDCVCRRRGRIEGPLNPGRTLNVPPLVQGPALPTRGQPRQRDALPHGVSAVTNQDVGTEGRATLCVSRSRTHGGY
jgi:hypothetical protein